MENTEQKKNKDNGGSFFKNFFEIKRPVKQQSATLPRIKDTVNSDIDNYSSKDRLFVRHQSYRRNSRRNKYKKENNLKNSKDTYSIEAESNVKKLCQQFEEKQLNAHQNIHQAKKTIEEMENKTGNKELDTEKIRSDTNMYSQLDLLKEAHKNTDVKRRILNKNSKRNRESKIKSFAEAENDEEAEEYRKSLINEMDMEIAQMRQDGFIDDDDILVTDNNCLKDDMQDQSKITNEDKDYYLLNLDPSQFKRCSNDSDNNTIILNENEKEYGSSNENGSIITESNKNTNKNISSDTLINNFNDEFTESLCDDLENGLFVVEAYNDDGRELIVVQVMIDRRTVNLDVDKQSMQEAIKHSDMVFYKNEDNSFNFIQNSKTLDLLEYAQADDKELSPSTSAEERLYGYVEIPNEQNEQEPFLVFAPLSNRSTIYSTTSQESNAVDDDDEGIELGRNKDSREDIYSNVRRETFCDDKGVVRIERVAFSDNLQFPNEHYAPPVSRSNSTASSKRLEFIIEEIKATEKKYVDDLAKVVKLYKPFIERHAPTNLKCYQGYLFGNLEKIYRRQRKFLYSIEKSIDVDEVIQCFIDHELLFELYPHYFRNKPKADNLLKEFNSIIKEMQETFEERLDFSAYLLTPVQRLGKYILFLENIEKQLTKLMLPVENAQKALAMVREEMSKGNDSVAIESIGNSPISKMDYGSFKMREKFNISKPRKVEAMVFLFENVLVFTTCDPVQLEVFYYYDRIKMNDLRIATFDDFTIHLTDFTKSKKKQNATKYTYILETKTEKIWKTWKETIEKMLWEQLVKAKELTKSQEVRKRYKTGERSRIKSTEPA